MPRVLRLITTLLLGAALLPLARIAGAGPAAPGEAPPPPHKIAVDVRGPVALVQVSRVLPLPGNPREGGEVLLDLALPERAVLLDVEVSDGGRWRAAEAVEAARGRDAYLAGVKERGLSAASEPFDDSAVYRIRVARGAPLGGTAGTSISLRYRYSAIAGYAEGRQRLRFPAALESMPAPADVQVALSGAADVEIAGARTTLGAGGRGSATGRVSTRSGWEISWAAREDAAAGSGPSLQGTLAAAPLSAAESVVAFAVEGRAGKPVAPPPNVLLLIDRSRSVGLPGLSAERDLARKLLEILPPATRFDALFFDRATKRLFPMERPATREAISALEAEMVPDRLQNGTDLGVALHEAAALLHREASAFAPRTLLVIVTDGALPDDEDGAALDRALGALPGLDLLVAAFAVRVPEDDAVGPAPRKALRALAGARGGLYREVRTNEIDDAARAAVAALGQGGDVGGVRFAAAGQERPLADGLAPGEGLAGVIRLLAKPPRSAALEGLVRGQRTRFVARPQVVDASWLRPHLGGGAQMRLLATAGVVALVEPVLRPDGPGPHDLPVKGTMDRMVVRNTLSLAYMPRARACYLNRTGATPALRSLEGRVRIAIDLVRGEVARARLESSTLNHPEIESCLRDGAFAFEVPRALHNDAPVTAILNLVFRPRTADKKRETDEALGDQIDLIIEELHRTEQAESAAPPAAPAAPSPAK